MLLVLVALAKICKYKFLSGKPKVAPLVWDHPWSTILCIMFGLKVHCISYIFYCRLSNVEMQNLRMAARKRAGERARIRELIAQIQSSR